MIFLLGGYDLEMLEIKNILDSHKINYLDKQLSWGASLSDYKDDLNHEGKIYGIELYNDIPAPSNYIEIDHHNDNSHKVSSLEQVANILNITLSRHQMLIAKNDSEYIAGMKKLCATQKEIEHIRFLDRKAQGITESDNLSAEESIQEANGSNIIFSKTDKFTAISDKVYSNFSNYIIYNETMLSFYGYTITEVKSFLQKHAISKDSFYYGGGAFGFLGIKKNSLSKEKIKSLIKEFSVNKKTYSHHTFMLPFTYDIDDKDSITSNWDYKEYTYNYNEATYFHKFFKDSMFTNKRGSSSDFFTASEYKNTKFILTKEEEFTLNLKSINLRMFTTGVGILSFHIENNSYESIQDILTINEFARRVYPEYLDKNNCCSLIPDSVQIQGVTEDFKNFKNTEPQDKLQLSKIITQFLPADKITPAVDDRMFVISFYKNNAFANDLKQEYKKNDKWYEYVFIDADGKTVQNTQMQTEFITQATYPRWQNYGTLYGVSKYSFVAVAESSSFIEENVEVHMQTMYFQMFSLLLMVRATILRFSLEVSEIAKDIDKSSIAKDVESLYKRYIQFVNQFYFREITAKDQGLEIYEKALNILNIERDIKDLDAEIEELHKFVELKRQKEIEIETYKTNKKLNNITEYGAYLLIASFLTGIFGMNVGEKENFDMPLALSLIFSSIFISWIYFKVKGES